MVSNNLPASASISTLTQELGLFGSAAKDKQTVQKTLHSTQP